MQITYAVMQITCEIFLLINQDVQKDWKYQFTYLRVK